MELNQLSKYSRGFDQGDPSPNPLLAFALSPEAAWACTTCGACIDVCPVGDEPMLDIIDIRRQQVMIEGEFPTQLQTAFRGMERANNPWGINHDKRLDWAEGLNVKTTEQNPEPDVLFWVGCAASYDPQSQKTARAFVQLLDHAGVDFAVLGKRECCTGDSARRAGNEYLYRQLADTNVATLNEIRPKLIVATCPHCMNTVGKEYKQLGGDFKVMHHTEYLETLVSQGKLVPAMSPSTITYHDPCYLGRHNGIYDPPRNLLNVLSNSVVELPRNRENSFCCGAGGAQFWKEEEEGTGRISDNRYREAQQVLEVAEDKVLAVGCPFCKSMLESTPGRGADTLSVRDIAELLLDGVQQRSDKQPVGAVPRAAKTPTALRAQQLVGIDVQETRLSLIPAQAEPQTNVGTPIDKKTRKKWVPKAAPLQASPSHASIDMSAVDSTRPLSTASPEPAEQVKRKRWKPKQPVATEAANAIPPTEADLSLFSDSATSPDSLAVHEADGSKPLKSKAWAPKSHSEK